MSLTKLLNTSKWYAAGLHFECAQCGACCCGPDEGYIWVTKEEIKLIAEFLNLSIHQLRSRFLHRVGWRSTIIEEPVSKDCIFLKKEKNRSFCGIYPVRPMQCRTWPFWSANLTSANAWNKVAQKCPGINRGRLYDAEEIERVRKMKNWWSDEK